MAIHRPREVLPSPLLVSRPNPLRAESGEDVTSSVSLLANAAARLCGA
jgi:hypothetical protein